jgi:Undecaprenyl-phosphate galactose phosphotransferase WbaP
LRPAPGLLLLAGDALALALLAWLLIGLGQPAGGVPRSTVLCGFLFVPVLKSAFGLYAPAGLAFGDRLRRWSRVVAIGTASLAIPWLSGEWNRPFTEAMLGHTLLGFLASFATELITIYGLMAFGTRWRLPVVIIGAGRDGRHLAEKLQRLPWLGMVPLCFFDDDHRLWQTQVADLPVVGPVKLLMTPNIHTAAARAVIIADPSQRHGELYALVKALPFKQAWCMVGEGQVNGLDAEFQDLNGSLALRLRVREPGGYIALRRVADLVLAATLLLLLAPLLLVIAVAIRLDDGGPALFRQRRWGGGDTVFELLKFRSMRLDAEGALRALLDADPALRQEYETHHKLARDPRITRVGRVLRRTSLDELPQLWNVLRGDMSLIGPRAYMPAELPDIGEAATVIGQVPPGVTGYWQVSGRHRTTFQQRVEMDVFYVRNAGPAFDVHILLKTAALLFTCNGS